ncbi:MAG: DUF5009 domain-containing protein [Paludibacteraceae bacterium]|nr:DUF5009 domain-containing protein [Paludibacteraceae bacterium]
MSSSSSKRLLALDVLRGITIAGMITVNNPGSWSHIYAPLQHAEWNGCTPTDLVFPFFMFVMGVAMYISWQKTDFRLTGRALWKLFYRGTLLILIGWAIATYGIMLRGLTGGGTLADVWDKIIHHLRFPGVLPRLGIVSMLGGFCLLAAKPKRILWVAGTLLIVYCLIIGLTDSFYLSPDNIVSRIDVAVFGENHLYHKGGIAFDPEGLLSTIPCIGHCLLGAYAGGLIMRTENKWEKVNGLFIFGSIVLLSGFLLDYAFPINKSLWSASYVLVTCGLASLLLALLIWIIDIRGYRRWAVFFESFGANPLFIFVLSGFFAITLSAVKIPWEDGQISLWGFWYNVCMMPLFGEKGGSLACALSLVVVLWLIAHPLYRKKIYIKL